MMLMALCLALMTGDFRPVHTYSIVAHDAKSGQIGVAVQSHWFAVGPVVAWAEAGVGAVATQSIAEVSYGPLGLTLMRSGKSPQQALSSLLASDQSAAFRQIAMVDAKGNVASHTGSSCIAEAGHLQGDGFSVQANIMVKNTVWQAMAQAFTGEKGDLAQRMLAALKAAQAEGGDLRGMQSAALIVVNGTSSGVPWKDRIYDLRIDDHPQPLKELERHLNLARAYHLMEEGDEHMGLGNMERALEAYNAAMTLQPENGEMVFWTAVTLVGSGRKAEAMPFFKKAFSLAPAFRALVPRLVPSGILPDDPALMKEISER